MANGFELDYSRFLARLRAGRQKIQREALVKCGQFAEARVQEDTAAAFRSETSPAGDVWKKSLRANVQGGKTLADTGRLKRSIRTATKISGSKLKLVAGTLPLVYSTIHQFGGVIVPIRAKRLRFTLATGKRVSAKRVDMPPRPYVGLSSSSVAKIRQYIKANIGGDL